VKFLVPLSAAALLSVPVSTFAYDTQVSNVPVGMIRVYGNAGVQAFRRSDGGTFPGCTNDSDTMWADTTYLTADGRKSLLGLLLSAKATGSLVRVYYTTADGYCRFQIVDIQ
jgi:hypothetical protein